MVLVDARNAPEYIVLAGARNTAEWFWPVPGMQQDGYGGCQECSKMVLGGARNAAE
jgi:hypothetical protein